MTEPASSPELPAESGAPGSGDGSLPLADTVKRIRQLDRELASARKWSLKSTRQLHASMLEDVKSAERRARQAERRAVAAEERLGRVQNQVRLAEAEVAAMRESATWKAGRAVMAVPARVQRWRRT